MSKKVVLTAKPTGVEVEAVGFHGEGCQAVVEGIVASMGAAVEASEPERKSEYYATETVEVKEQA